MAVYLDVVMTASDVLFTSGAAKDIVKIPSLKEVYFTLGRTCIAIKVVERRAPLSPRMFRRYVSMLLKHARETCRTYVHPVIVTVSRLTIGALTAAAKMRWLRVLSAASLGERLTRLLRITLREIASMAAPLRRRGYTYTVRRSPAYTSSPTRLTMTGGRRLSGGSRAL